MFRIVYVSAAATYDNSDFVVESIVKQSISRNRAAQITGALIYTGRHFAQLIEGPEDQVRYIYGSIEKDTRHSHLKVLIDERVQERLFQSWSLAYAGSASYVSKPIERIINTLDPFSSDKVIRILMEFSKFNRDTL